jgi:polysaccharide biosynthesis transport protein
MEVQDYLKIFRRRWRTVLLTLLLALAAAGVYLVAAPREYEARSELFVSWSGSDSSELLQGSSFTQQRVKSYARAIVSPLVLEPVVEELQLDGSADDLSKRVSTEVPLDTVLIELAVRDSDPQRAVATAEAITSTFIDVVPELEQSAGATNPVTVTVLRDGTASDRPVSPNLLLAVAAATVLGLVLGLSLAVLRELTDVSIGSESDVRRVTDVPVIGTIQHAKDAKSSPLAVRDHPHSKRAEEFRTLRTNLQFVAAARQTSALVVTSSVPGEGKSTTSANLALALGESGARVCVVEADLRRPRMVEYLGVAAGAGLTNLLIGDASYDDVLQPLGSTNVTVLAAGPIPPNPSELLGSPAMKGVVEHLTSTFDHVIFDAPPLLPVTDAAVLGRHAGGVVVVVGAGIVRRDQVRRTMELLTSAGAEVRGVVVNRAPASRSEAYTYYRDDDEPPGDPAELDASAPSTETAPAADPDPSAHRTGVS